MQTRREEVHILEELRMRRTAQAWLTAFAVVAALILFFEGLEARRERQQLADDLYRLCEHMPVAFPALSAINPKRYELTQGQPFFRAQAALKEACGGHNAKALGEARERQR
jgi:hypothetical protein